MHFFLFVTNHHVYSHILKVADDNSAIISILHSEEDGHVSVCNDFVCSVQYAGTIAPHSSFLITIGQLSY